MTAPVVEAPHTAPYAAVALRCAADVQAETFSCEEIASSVRGSLESAIGATDSLARRAPRGTSRFGTSSVVLLGGQGALIRMRASNTGVENLGSFNRLTTWIQVRNHLTQALGTVDGVTADPNGIVVFLPQAGGANPAVVSGTGTVSPVNYDTTGFWTSPGEAGFKYPGLIPAGGETDYRKWAFDVGASVTSFETTVYVATRLADETTTTLTAAAPPMGFASLVASNSGRTCGLRDGTTIIYCWGRDMFGAQGGGDAAGRPGPTAPVSIPVAASVEVGNTHACALTTAGIAYCWGDNQNTQISASGSFHMVPRYAVGNLSFAMLSSADAYNCGITGAHPSAKLWCWGWNGAGQLGDGTTNQRSAPTLIATLEQLVTVSTGNQFACGLTNAGAAYCWGKNGNGELGDGTTTQRLTPTAVTMPSGVAFSSISAGEFHTCAISTSGSTPANAVFCWGRNSSGELGDGTTIGRTTPTLVSGATGYTKVQAARDHSCALNGTTLWCWGGNNFGQLGDGTNTQRLTPVSVSGAFMDFAASVTLTCALNTSGSAYCWGDNSLSTTDATFLNRNVPTAVGGGFTFTQISAGGLTACGRESSGAVRCWGDDRRAQMGDGSISTKLLPQGVVSSVNFSWDVTVGSSHTCGLSTGGQAYCWGGNGARQLGDGTTSLHNPSPVAVTTTAGVVTFAGIIAGDNHTCGLTAAGAAWCWGQNHVGQRGDGTITTTNSATAVSGGHTFVGLATGWQHTCGIDDSGAVWCWGRNNEGQLGRGDTLSTPAVTTPVAVAIPGGLAVTDLKAGQYYTCATTATGASYCWGQNTHGQLGDGTQITRPSPTLVAGGHVFVDMALGSTSSCGLKADGLAFCWGENTNGQVGDNTFVGPVLTPKAVLMPTGGVTFSEITGGGQYMCAIANTTNAGYCWGSNYHGQFGNGSNFRSPRPTQVFFQ